MAAYRYGISLLVFNSKRNSISTRTHVLFAIYLSSDQRCFWIKVWAPIFLSYILHCHICRSVNLEWSCSFLSPVRPPLRFGTIWIFLWTKKKGRVRNRVYVLKSRKKRVVLNVDWKLIAISLLEWHVRIKAYRVRIICLQNHRHKQAILNGT